MARDLSGGGGSQGTHVGNKTHVNKASAYTAIAFSSTNNKVKCPYCNGTWFEVKGGDSVDAAELDVNVDGQAASELNMVVFKCHCGREFAKNLAVDGEWTEQT